MLLALDTSGAGVSVALHDGAGLIAEHAVAGGQRHAEQLAPAVADLLQTAGRALDQVTSVIVGVGPGPFTGLRVGLVTAQVLAQTLAVPLHGVCSLDALAEAAARAGLSDGPLLVATDARRREVYWAQYELRSAWPGGWRRTAGPAVDDPAVPGGVVAEIAVGRVVGRGAQLYPERLGTPPSGLQLDAGAGALAAIAARALAAGMGVGSSRVGEPGAADLAAGNGHVLLPARPLYLRRPDAQTPGARKRVLS